MRLTEVFPKNKKLISSLKLWIDRKFAIYLITVKSYKIDFVFLLAATIKDITNHSLKLAMVFS